MPNCGWCSCSAAQASSVASLQFEQATTRLSELEKLEAEVGRLRDKETRLDEATEELEKARTENHRVTSHREELTEWVESTLLPLAEANDPDLARLKKDTDEMAKEVERIRGLSFKRPLMRRLIKRSEVGKQMRRDMEREMPPDEARKMIQVMAEFGVVDPDTDLYALFSEFMEQAASAFYKPHTQTFYLIEGNTGPGARPVIFHELVHALEDQYYDLEKLIREREDDGDAAMAIKALTEGSADMWQTLYQNDHPDEFKAMMQAEMGPERQADQMKMLQKVPTFLIAMMALYPYKNGSAFLRGIGADSPERIEQVWKDPPASTEQICH